MMRKLIRLVAILSFMGVSSSSWAVQVSSDGRRGDANTIDTAVFNNQGSALTSGTVVIWDTASGNTDVSMGAWVVTTTTADSNLVAGIVKDASIADQSIGTILIYGPTTARYADSTDGSADTAGTAIGTTSVAGQFGNGTGLGCILRKPAGLGTADNENIIIFVNPSNAE